MRFVPRSLRRRAVTSVLPFVVALVLISLPVRRELARLRLIRLVARPDVDPDGVEGRAGTTGRWLLTFRSTTNWGLGNAMFAFASTVGTVMRDGSDRNGSSSGRWVVCFDDKLPLRNAFEPLADWPACQPDDVIELLRAAVHFEVGYARHDDRIPSRLPRDRHVVLDRFLQSWKYFAGVEREIRRLFRFTDAIRQVARDNLADAVYRTPECRGRVRCADGDDDHVLVGVHVRRGDIAMQRSLAERGYVTPNATYLERAMDFMDTRLRHRRLRPIFVVCSDDMDWCRDNVPSKWSRHVAYVSTRDPVVDMAVLAQCRHSIITVGTFGWWSAWLANGTTVYYRDWPRPGSQLAGWTNHEDYFPPHWIGI